MQRTYESARESGIALTASDFFRAHTKLGLLMAISFASANLSGSLSSKQKKHKLHHVHSVRFAKLQSKPLHQTVPSRTKPYQTVPNRTKPYQAVPAFVLRYQLEQHHDLRPSAGQSVQNT